MEGDYVSSWGESDPSRRQQQHQARAPRRPFLVQRNPTAGLACNATRTTTGPKKERNLLQTHDSTTIVTSLLLPTPTHKFVFCFVRFVLFFQEKETAAAQAATAIPSALHLTATHSPRSPHPSPIYLQKQPLCCLSLSLRARRSRCPASGGRRRPWPPSTWTPRCSTGPWSSPPAGPQSGSWGNSSA